MTDATQPPLSPLKALLEASANSPLAEAESNSLDELMERVRETFNTKPLELTDEGIASNVSYYRLKRHQFAELAKQKESEPKKTRSKRSASSISQALEQAVNEIEL